MYPPLHQLWQVDTRFVLIWYGQQVAQTQILVLDAFSLNINGYWSADRISSTQVQLSSEKLSLQVAGIVDAMFHNAIRMVKKMELGKQF
jgi:hypothetical protein